jgi:putative membrane protein insertion efficiency factor
VKRILAAPLLLLIRLYQRIVSPLFPRRCRYEPTCSAYATQAVRELGVARGSIVAGWRLLRCNPFSNGGLDPLSERRLFRGDDDHPAHTHSHAHTHTHAGHAHAHDRATHGRASGRTA